MDSHRLTFGGGETLLSRGVDPQVAEGPTIMENPEIAAVMVGSRAVSWSERLPLHYRHGNYLSVHAGVRSAIPLRKQHADDLLWIKDDFLESDVVHGIMVVHGHTIVEYGSDVRRNRVRIDTCADCSGRLTALAIEGEETWYLSTPDVLQLTDGQAPTDRVSENDASAIIAAHVEVQA